MFFYKFCDARTKERKNLMQPLKFFYEYSQGNLTTKVLPLQCFVIWLVNANIRMYVVISSQPNQVYMYLCYNRPSPHYSGNDL